MSKTLCVVIPPAVGSAQRVEHLVDTVIHVDIFQYHASCQSPHHAEERPWASIWTKPMIRIEVNIL